MGLFFWTIPPPPPPSNGLPNNLKVEINNDNQFKQNLIFMYIIKNSPTKSEVNLHKALCEYEDFEEDSAQHASKQTEGNNHLNHEIPENIG